jgi:hypothetical protein
LENIYSSPKDDGEERAMKRKLAIHLIIQSLNKAYQRSTKIELILVHFIDYVLWIWSIADASDKKIRSLEEDETIVKE